MPMCYMCNNEQTSREHTPPRSFFPRGYRNNLITVASCNVHNEQTSLDDEYARNIITASIKNNQVSVDHFFDKSYRSFQRHPGLVQPILDSLRDVSFYEENAKAFQIDRPRFDRVIRKIAYSLYYHEYNTVWERLLAVATNQIRMSDMSNDHLGEIFDELSKDLDNLTLKGENPEIFQYCFFDFGENPFDKALFMIFYEGFPIWIIPDKESTHADLN